MVMIDSYTGRRSGDNFHFHAIRIEQLISYEEGAEK